MPDLESLLTPTFQYVDPPELPMDWASYVEIVEQEWADLRANTSAAEADYQSFFERHPCMLPLGYRSFAGGHHGAFPTAVISQPPFSGLVRRVPDFMAFSRDSAEVHVLLIEIERPDKEWFTAAGQPSADLTQAIDQLREWKQWLADPINMQQFKRDYRLPEIYRNYLNFRFHYILIYGSRNQRTGDFRDKRSFLQQPDEKFMTFDRMFPDKDLAHYSTVKLDQNGYRAISYPPTIRLGPIYSEYNAVVSGKETAIQNNLYLSEIRKKFLVQRLPYWDEICRNGRPQGVIHFSKTGE